MNKDGLSTVIIDSAELFRGLDALSKPRSKWSLKHGTNMYSGLRLSYNLMIRDRVYYDGNVRSENTTLIEESLQLIEVNMGKQIANDLRFRIHPITFNKEEEKVFTKEAIRDAVTHFQDISKHLDSRFFEFDFGKGLTDIEWYLYNPCLKDYSSKQLLDAIFDNKKITGRRFYVSIFEDEEILNRVKGWIKEDAVSPKQFNLMFTLFRAMLSESKRRHLEKRPAIAECFYDPDKLRRDLLEELPMENEQAVNHNKILGLAMHSVWLAKNNFTRKRDDVDVPVILNLPLHESDKQEFLRSVLGFSESDFKRQYDEALAIIRKTKIHNINETINNLEVALRSANAKASALTDSGNMAVVSQGQDLAKFFISAGLELGQDALTEGSVTGLLGAVTRLTAKITGKGISAASKIHKSFGSSIVSMSRENRNLNLDKIFS